MTESLARSGEEDAELKTVFSFDSLRIRYETARQK
jgi:hypothetical protein